MKLKKKKNQINYITIWTPFKMVMCHVISNLECFSINIVVKIRLGQD